MSAPQTVEWSALSPQAREATALIALRLTAGFSMAEIVTEINRDLLGGLTFGPEATRKARRSRRESPLRA